MIEKIIPIIFFIIITLFNGYLYLYLKKHAIKVSKEEKKGDNFFVKKKYKEAINIYKNVLSKDEVNKRVIFLLGICYYMIGEKDKAIENLYKAVILNKDDIIRIIKAYRLLINLHLEKKNFNEAKKALEKYGYFYKQIKEDCPASIKEEEKNRYEETIGWIRYCEGNYSEAIKIYEELIPLWCDFFKKKSRIEKKIYSYSDIFYHFGIISKHKGEYKKAIKYFKKSIKDGGPESIFSKRSEEEIRKIVNGEL